MVLHKEMLIDYTSAGRDLRISQDFIDFSFTESGRFSDTRQVTVENNYPFKVEVTWNLLNVFNKTTGQWVKNPFRVSPDTATIGGKGSFNFNVEFAPYEPDQYFFQIA